MTNLFSTLCVLTEILSRVHVKGGKKSRNDFKSGTLFGRLRSDSAASVAAKGLSNTIHSFIHSDASLPKHQAHSSFSLDFSSRWLIIEVCKSRNTTVSAAISGCDQQTVSVTSRTLKLCHYVNYYVMSRPFPAFYWK